MPSQADLDRESLCIGACYQTEKPYTHMYWADWALELMAEGFRLHAPGVHYWRNGDVIYRRNVIKNTEHLYLLQDEYDHEGRQLGRWPD